MRYLIFIGISMLLTTCGKNVTSGEKSTNSDPAVLESLPFETLPLSDLSAFADPGQNWQVAQSVWADMNKDLEIQTESGTGVLVNEPTEETQTNLISNLEHGDLEIKFEVMMPKGSNSGFYFQSRYELQLLDSWGKEDVSHGDMGGIYERWDESKPEGEKGYEGTPPMVNAAKAPGLWQQFHVYFKAPRFNDQGEKIKNASFEYVYLNGMLIQEDVEQTGPTRGAGLEGEAAWGPFLIQGDHGPVAFRNIEYKAYGLDTLALTDVTYERYKGKWDYLPSFDSIAPESSGEVSFLDLTTSSDQADHYGLVFNGKLHVPTSGEYLFETAIDDGGDLYIDSQLVVHNLGEPGLGIERGLVHLDAGIHDFKMTYYQEIWLALLTVKYEGPQIAKRTLASTDLIAEWEAREAAQPAVAVTKLETPEMLGGFVEYGGEKLTHTLSVGDPSGVHFSYDLRHGFVIKSWKGDYADVSEMWRGRGQSQLLKPLNAAIEFTSGVPIASLSKSDAAWPAYISDDFSYRGYRIDQDGRPVFQYHYKNIQLEDKLSPGSDKKSLNRNITFASQEPVENTYYRLQAARNIVQLENGLYSVDGQYYLQTDEEVDVAETSSGTELRFPVSNEGGLQSFSYNILW